MGRGRLVPTSSPGGCDEAKCSSTIIARGEFVKKTLLTLTALALPALSQTTIKDAMIKHWKATGELTLAVAKAMPADDYSFKPNPEEMSFGQLIAHIALADRGACANASGMKAPDLTGAIASFAKDNKQDV